MIPEAHVCCKCKREVVWTDCLPAVCYNCKENKQMVSQKESKPMISKDEFLELFGEFVWFWDDYFFIETPKGNFVWRDPEYNGDNTIRPYDGEISKFCRERKVGFGRSKGRHRVRDYCGEDIVLVLPS